ncbi:MAG TPA: peptide chain release factor N(5)-glutamine methyltransferase [Candidatus Paceibacterota bacterium]|nr:peptide chain release factor N(5)-glutamine methyltransferase [Candidatus Paceibacterota bacterium]
MSESRFSSDDLRSNRGSSTLKASGPIQYLDGSTEFCGHRFKTDRRALIPRFETEYLVRRTLEWCAKNNQTCSIIDVGTGSGVIAISLALSLPEAKITAIDLSSGALELARENAVLHHVDDRISFLQSDLLENFSGSADVILANLPYIPTERVGQLDSSVKDHEPHSALDGGPDGLAIYRRLFEQLKSLKPKFCIFEMDDDQAESIRKELEKSFSDSNIEIVKDTSDFNRYAILEIKQ